MNACPLHASFFNHCNSISVTDAVTAMCTKGVDFCECSLYYTYQHYRYRCPTSYSFILYFFIENLLNHFLFLKITALEINQFKKMILHYGCTARHALQVLLPRCSFDLISLTLITGCKLANSNSIFVPICSSSCISFPSNLH